MLIVINTTEANLRFLYGIPATHNVVHYDLYNLVENWSTVVAKNGFKDASKDFKRKKISRKLALDKKRLDYREYYTDEMRREIEHRFAIDLKLFSYKF